MRFGPVSGASIALLFVVAGCGGGGGDNVGRGEVSGVVFDGAGHAVKGATVYVDQGGTRETVTDSLGAYVLRDVVAQDVVVGAQTPDGAYVGENLARVFKNERDVSVNIALYPAGSLARIVGRVRNASGSPLSGVRVFARPTDSSVLSSASAVTDGAGYYTIDRLARNVAYRLLANDIGRGEGTFVLTPMARETTQDITLGNASNPTLAAPTNLEAVAYTTTGAATVSRSIDASKQAHAMEAVKRLLDPKRAARQAKKAQSRNTALYDEPIEVDLFWDEYTTTDTYGFGVYRYLGSNTTGAQTFLHDPLAAYFDDGDEALRDGVTYTYRITAISSSYDGNGRGESAFSNSSTVVPLSELVLSSPVGQTLRWQGVPGAANYKAYVYSTYPDLGVAPIYSTPPSTTGTSLALSGSFTSGHTYYYVIVGSRSDGSAQVLSPVATFVP